MASRLITTNDGGLIEVVEWSNTGAPLLFLAGMTHTAHAFDYLVQHFCADYRCVGVTRRGFGRSGTGDEVDGVMRLALDVIEVIEQSRLGAVVLVGHSFGCREAELVCRLRPDLVRGAVLLDGAYDYSGDADFMSQFDVPGPPAPAPGDLVSPQALGAWYLRTFGIRLPPDEITGMYEFDEVGRCIGQRVDHLVVTAAVNDVSRPNWSGLPEHVLAIFASPQEWQVYAPGICALDTGAQQSFARFFDAMMDYREAQIDAFAESLPGAMIGRPAYSNHYLHLSHEWLVVQWMRVLLDSVQASDESTTQPPRNEIR